MNALEEYLEVSFHSYKWANMTLVEQGRLRTEAAAELAQLRNQNQRFTEWHLEQGRMLTDLRAQLAQLKYDRRALTDNILVLRAEMIGIRRMWKKTIDENTQLRAENAEMLEALNEIVAINSGKYRDMYERIRKIARAILAKYPEETK